MKALLLVAHGSRRKDSNDEVRRLTHRIRENSGPAFSKVECAFLEISCPQVDSAINDLAIEGVTEILIFPYFLASGTHVTCDIPRLIEEEQANHPTMRFDLLPHLGALQGVSSLILDHIYSSAPRTSERPPSADL